MGRPSLHSKKMRILIGILKDKISIIKSTLLFTNKTTLILRATTHSPTNPPPESTVDEILSEGLHYSTSASAVVESLLRRLRRTGNVYVALKCLLTLHHLLSRGSPVLKAQISAAVGPHNNLLNLSNFRDHSDPDTWALSSWVCWYAGVLEHGLSSSVFLSPLNRVGKMGDLVRTVEQICRAPESLHYQRVSLVYEAVKLVGEDYRKIMTEILARIREIEGGVENLREEEMYDLLGNLTKMEECKEKVAALFVNKKMNDGGWDLIAQTRAAIMAAKRRRESMRLVVGNIPASKPRGNRWLDVAWNPLVVVDA